MKKLDYCTHVCKLIIFSTCLLFVSNSTSKEFIIGVEDVSYYPLFDFTTQRNTYAKELLDLFAKSKGYKFIYLPLPIKRFERWLIEEKIDFKYPDNARWYPDPSIRGIFTFSDSTIKLVAGTTVLRSFLEKNKNEFKSIGTLWGFYPTTWIKQITKGEVKLHEDTSTTILVRQLLSNTVDGIDIEPSVINHYLTKLDVPLDTVLIDKRYRYDVYDYHFSTIKHPEIIKEFNIFLNDNKALIKSIIKKYKIVDYRLYLK